MKFFILCTLMSVLAVNLAAESESSEPQTRVAATIQIRIDDILRQITEGLLNSRNGNPNGFYEVSDDGSIHFVYNDDTKEAFPTTSVAPSSPVTTTTPEPDLSHDEPEDPFSEDGLLWEFVSKRVPEPRDPLTDSEEFPLVNTNEIETESAENEVNSVQRRKRDVKVDVGGEGGSGLVDVAVNKPGKNVAVNVGGVESFLNQLGVYFKKPSGANTAVHTGSGAVDVNVNKPNSNVDVSVNKPGGQTAVNVDWASFIPFVNVGVNKGGNRGGSKVDVNVGQGGSAGGLVDVKVNKGQPKPYVDEADDAPHKHVDVDLRSGFADHSGDDLPPPPRPHKKHRRNGRPHPEHEDKDVSVNVGGQNGGSWWPFVNVNVDSAKSANVGKSSPRKCVNVNVPFVNVLINRGCQDSESNE